VGDKYFRTLNTLMVQISYFITRMTPVISKYLFSIQKCKARRCWPKAHHTCSGIPVCYYHSYKVQNFGTNLKDANLSIYVFPFR